MSLVFYTRFDGNSNDISGLANNGSDTNVAYSTQGFKQAATMNGSSSLTSISASATLNALDQNYTVSFWINTGTAGNADQTVPGIVEKRDTNTSDRTFVFSISDDGYAQFGCQDGANWATTIDSVDIADSKRHHIVGTKSTNDIYLYVDGKYIATASVSDPAASNENITVGCRRNDGGSNTSFYTGKIDDLRIYNETYNATQVKNLYASYKGFI